MQNQKEPLKSKLLYIYLQKKNIQSIENSQTNKKMLVNEVSAPQ